MNEVVAVVSDLHANARSLRATLAAVDRAGADHLVILGDLLSYGVEDEEVLDLVEDRTSRGASLVLGNHDQLYLDLAAGDRAYYDPMPTWLKESVDRAAARLDVERFRKLPWAKRVTRSGWVFQHANPYAYGDWTYLNADVECRRAAGALRDLGARGGVFGHTHRRRAWAFAPDGSATAHGDTFEGDDPREVWIVNPGSTGQPRQTDRAATWLRLGVGDRVDGALSAVDWDVDGHRAALAASGLSDDAVRRLTGFFG